MDEKDKITEEETSMEADNTEETLEKKTEETKETEDTNSDNAEGNDAEEEESEDPVEKLQKEVEVLKDKYLRSVAEFDNYRKRTLKEKSDLILNGSVTAVKAILPILDDIERALTNGKETEDANVLREGMELIYKKFESTLTSLGVKKIETEGVEFNTDYHNAVAMVPGMGEDKKGKIIDCIQTGYTLNDKVIRHAKVAVGD